MNIGERWKELSKEIIQKRLKFTEICSETLESTNWSRNLHRTKLISMHVSDIKIHFYYYVQPKYCVEIIIIVGINH